MDVTVVAEGDCTLVRLGGRLTFAENQDFRRMIATLDQSKAMQVIIDLGGLDYIDVAGLGMLLAARDDIVGRGGRVLLRNPAAQVGRMLDLARFSDFFDVQPAG